MFKKMFTITPFLLLSIGLILYGVGILIFATFFAANSEGWEKVYFLFLGIIAVAIGGFDLLMKLFISNSKVIIIAQLALIAIFAINHFSKRIEQKVILPAEFSDTYATIIFNVEGKKPIPNRYSLVNKPIVFKDGYLLTSTGHKQYEHDHFVLTYANGKKVDASTSDYRFYTLPVGHFEQNGKTYYYLTFKLQPKEDCCGYGGRELDQYKERIVADFPKLQKRNK